MGKVEYGVRVLWGFQDPGFFYQMEAAIETLQSGQKSDKLLE